jgi:hypothetical protein
MAFSMGFPAPRRAGRNKIAPPGAIAVPAENLAKTASCEDASGEGGKLCRAKTAAETVS